MHDRRDPYQAEVEALFRDEPGDLVLPAPVTAEVDYLIHTRLGEASRRGFLADLAAGRYRVEALEPQEYDTVARLEETYGDVEPGLTDLSIVVIAHRVDTNRIATFDERHFRAMRPLAAKTAFQLLPRDA